MVCLDASQAQSVQSLVKPSPTALKISPLLQETNLQTAQQAPVTFIYGDRISGRPDIETKVEGNAELRRSGTVIQADKLEYQILDDKATAINNVRLNRLGDIYEGTLLDLKVDSFSGYLDNPKYKILKSQGYGEGDRVDFSDAKHAIIHNASYSTCRRYPGPGWMPDWVLKAVSMNINTEDDVGQATDATLTFKGIPVPLPSISFPLSNKRKSGWLPPTYATDSINGFEFSVPYYVNLAPNRDTTIFPAYSYKRGLSVGTEFRYLEDNYNGQLRADVMPSDPLRDRTRWGFAGKQNMNYQTELGKVGLKFDINRVSDDNYWRDFSRGTASLTQRLLASEMGLNLNAEQLSIGLRVSKWQTLKDIDAPIVPPYDRLPQFTARYAKNNLNGFNFSITGGVTRFSSDASLTRQPNVNRGILHTQLSRPWLEPGWFFSPKLQIHASRYAFDDVVSNGARTANRVLPTFSVDSGLVFERDAQILGRNMLQTFEPRAFYTYTPYRDQSFIPLYDTTANDFSFVSSYLENSYSGDDRIADNDVLTLGATSRFLNGGTGAELARFSLAQRFRFRNQLVTLPGASAVTDRLSDLLIGSSVKVSPQWSIDATQQYNFDTHRATRSTIGVSYTPSNYRVLNLAYRLQKGSSEQVDLGWQWPLNDLWGDKGQSSVTDSSQISGRWYSVGRLNYSVADRKLVDSIVGFEYDAGCWLGRVVVESLARSNASSNSRVLFQLELIGFARIGQAGALKTLKINIPRYQNLHEQVTSPSRFTNYD